MSSHVAAPSSPGAAPSSAAELARLQLWGPPMLARPGQAPRPLERKLAAAVALAASGQGHSRERVAGLLWPDSGDGTARTNLRVLLHRAKDALGVSLVASGQGWSLAEGVRCDLADIRSEAWHRPMLEGCAFEDLEELRQALDTVQSTLRREAVIRSLTEAERGLTSGTREGQLQATALAQAVLTACPTDEPACRLLMKSQVALGQRHAALAHYERLRQTLSEEFGTQPDRQTRLLQLDILRDQAHTAPPVPNSDTDDARADVLRSPQAVGRQAVIEQLLTLGAQSRHAWLEADAGVGKSRVVEELLLRTAAVRVRCRPSDGQKAYAVLRRLIGQIVLERPAETQATMAELLQPGREGAGIDLHDVFDGVVETLKRLKRDGVHQLVVEDVHYLDAASGRLVNELVDAVTDDRSLAVQLPAFVLTARLQHDNPTFNALRQVVRADPNVQRIALRPLDLAETQALIEALMPSQPWLAAPGLAARLHAMSGGNSFFTLEIIRAAMATPEPATLAVRVDSVQQLLARRLRDASAEALELAGLLAVAQTDFDPRMPRDILGQDTRAMARSWQALVGLGIFKSDGFAHDLALAATQEALNGPQTQLLHAQVSEFLERHGGTDDRVAHHGLRSHSPAQALAAVQRFVQAMTREGTMDPAFALMTEAEKVVPALEHHEDGFRLLAKLALWWSLLPQRLTDSVPGALRRLTAAARTPEQQLLTRTVDWTARRFQPLGDRDVAGDLEALWQQPRLWPWWHWLAGLLIGRLREDRASGRDALSEKVDELLTGIETEEARWPEALLDLSQLSVMLTNLDTNDAQSQRVVALLAGWEALAQRSAATGLANSLRHMSIRICVDTEGYRAAAQRLEGVLPHFERRGVSEVSRNGAREWLRYYAGKGGQFGQAWRHRTAALDRRDVVSHPFVAAEADMFLAHGLGDIDGAMALVDEHPAARQPSSAWQTGILHAVLWNMERAAAKAECRPLRPVAVVHAKLPAPSDRQRLDPYVLVGQPAQDLAEERLRDPTIQASGLSRYEWRFKCLQAVLQQDLMDAARPLLESLLPHPPAWLGSDALTAPDSAGEFWRALVRCGHPEAEAYRDTWRRWRNEQTAELPPEWHASFHWRHAWVSDEPAPRPTAVPRGPWRRD